MWISVSKDCNLNNVLIIKSDFESDKIFLIRLDKFLVFKNIWKND